jgi:hypothetical protein
MVDEPFAHTAAKPYGGPDKIKWGDEEKWIDLLTDLITPMEHLFLNAGNISGSTRSSYKVYAEDFWFSCQPDPNRQPPH